MFFKITYDTIILERRAMFLDWKVLDKDKISVQKLYNTANQNNIVINN